MKDLVQEKVVVCEDLPEHPREDVIYRLTPKNVSESFYRERTDRNVGWITREEQEIFRTTVIGIAGCGGMGAQLAEKFLRLGVGELRIADTEVFDVSNINRQFAAGRTTIGKSKAFETAKLLREITQDTTLVVYPRGICEETANHFATGCDVICDEIEFWAIAARILLHQAGRSANVPIFCCPTVGFGTRLFLFTPNSETMEACIGFDYEEATLLQRRIQTKQASPVEVRRVMEHVLDGLIPELPEYCSRNASISNREFLLERLFEEGKATIIATNPPLATGFIADHVTLYLLRNSPITRTVVRPPEMPGYLFFDAAHMVAKVVREQWWNHDR